jgi:hypothetical protein
VRVYKAVTECGFVTRAINCGAKFFEIAVLLRTGVLTEGKPVGLSRFMPA